MVKIFAVILLVGAGLLSWPADAQQATYEQCARWEQQLRQIQSRLRSGYSNQQGNRLREQRRRLQQRLADECRRHRPR